MSFFKVIIMLVLFSFQNFAQAEDASGGCGPGWYIFKDYSLVSATSRGFINQVTGLAPIGMTFGTSGCDYHSIVEKKHEQIHFVKENLDQLEVELAVGKGHYVEQFASVMGCHQKPSHFINTMKKSYVKLFNKSSIKSSELLNNVKNTIKGHPYLSKECALI
ncbi:MAG: DUF3015 family protein [Bdellovibrionota bacterium]|nr:DUF3015 family protein [Bdellovibrionota bacterium]